MTFSPTFDVQVPKLTIYADHVRKTIKMKIEMTTEKKVCTFFLHLTQIVRMAKIESKQQRRNGAHKTRQTYDTHTSELWLHFSAVLFRLA